MDGIPSRSVCHPNGGDADRDPYYVISPNKEHPVLLLFDNHTLYGVRTGFGGLIFLLTSH